MNPARELKKIADDLDKTADSTFKLTLNLARHGQFNCGPRGLAEAEEMSKRSIAENLSDVYSHGRDDDLDESYFMQFPKAVLDVWWADTYHGTE